MKRNDDLPDPWSVESLINQGLAGLGDSEGNIALHLVGSPKGIWHVSWWSILILKLVEAGERLSAVNNEGKMAAQYLFQELARRDGEEHHSRYLQGSFVADPGIHEQVVLYKIVIHFMDELRQAETGLNDEDLDLLYFCCHRLIEVSGYSDDRAQALISETGAQSDQAVLDCLQTQKASGWQLPAFRNRYLVGFTGDAQRWPCIKSSDKWLTSDDGVGSNGEMLTVEGCLFCSIIKDASNAITKVYHGDWDDKFLVMGAIDPVTEGHILVIPRKHVQNSIVLGQTHIRAFQVASELCSDTDFTINASCGRETGQPLPHLVVGIVPRRAGDGVTDFWTGQRAGHFNTLGQPAHAQPTAPPKRKEEVN